MRRLSCAVSERALLLVLVSGIGVVPASAQQTPPANAPAPQKQSSQADQFDTINVTATKTEEKAIDALGPVTTVTAQDIKRFQSGTIADAMRSVPGVNFQESLNDPGQSVNIRGLQDFGRVNVLVDGARQNYQISGHNANGAFYLDPEFVSQIDVVRGPISNIYGSGAIGGVVAFRTKDVDDVLKPDEKYGVLQRMGIGTNGQHFFNSTAAAFRISPNVEAFGQFVYRSSSAYRDGAGVKVNDTGNELVGGLGKIRIRPAEGHEITLSGMKQGYQFANSGTSTTGSRFWDDVKTDTYTIGYRFTPTGNPLVDLSAKGYYTQTNNVQTLIQPTTTYYALKAYPGSKLSDKIRTRGFDINNTSRFSTWVFDHTLTVGGDSSWDRVNTVDYAGGYVSALTPSGDRRLSGAFVQDEIRFDRWARVLGALRYDNYALSGGSYSSSGGRLSPKIIAGISPLQGFEIYGSYSEGYRAPAITETLIAGAHPFPAFNILPNPTLKPEVAHNLEAGVNIKYDDVLTPGDKLRGKFNVFQNQISNFIDMTQTGTAYLVPFIPGYPVSTCATRPYLCFSIQSYQYQNVANARISGFEGEAAYDWRWGFVSVSGTSITGFNVATGVPLNSVYPSRLSSTLGFRFLNDSLTVGGRYTYVARSPTTVTTPSKSYGLVDLFANYEFDENIRADVALSNIFNRTYTQYLSLLPSAGFTAKFAVSVRFASK